MLQEVAIHRDMSAARLVRRFIRAEYAKLEGGEYAPVGRPRKKA